jgi:hypothetical protein
LRRRPLTQAVLLKRPRSFVVLEMLKSLSSSTLRKAAEIQGEIEHLEIELRNLLTEVGLPKSQDGIGRKNFIARRAKRQVNKGAQRSGVAAGVRQILRRQGKPMKVARIYTRLLAAGYSFRSSNPKNSLTAQMYRMRGVRRTGPGEFAAE